MPRYSRSAHPGDEAPKVKLTNESLRAVADLLHYLRPYRWRFAAALAAMLGSSVLAVSFPYFAGSLVDAALGRTGEQSWMRSVNQVTLVLLGIMAVHAFSAFLQSLWFNEVGERTLADLRRDTYARLIRLPMTFFAGRRVGELTSRIASDLALIQDSLIVTLPHLLRQVTLLAGGLILISATSGRLTLFMLGSLPFVILVAAVFGGRIRAVSRQAQDRLADGNVIVEETLQGVLNVKAFGNEQYEVERYGASLTAFLTTAIRGARYRATFVAFIIFALFGALVLVLWYGATLVHRGELSAGELARFLLATMFVAGALGSFADLYGQIQRTVGAGERVREILREQPEMYGHIRATVPTGPVAAVLKGDVEYVGVTFRYPSRPDVAVLRSIDLRIQAGERVALVGPSGAGKSTIVALLLRLYEPEAGRILIDGKDARDYGLAELRSRMAIVPQEVLLFGGTIAENIAYGRPGAREEEIADAASKANALDFIQQFPEGFRTRVGERGVQLSGGQRQRIAIARAILKDPAILILDEATSSLDSESESLVQHALDALMHGRTSLIIAHRLSTVRGADRIFVIKDGQTVEAGTHAELVDRADGLYRMLSQLQLDLK